MDRAEKIMTCLVLAGLIAVLVASHRRRGQGGNLTGLRMNMSASVCDSTMRGPAYLLQALPVRRLQDDFADSVSYWPVGGTPYQADDDWNGK